MTDGQWVAFPNKDCFPSDDVFTMDAHSLDAVKQHASENGYQAFVVFQDKAYFRSKTAKECKAALSDGQGPTVYLYLPKVTVTISFNHEDQYWTHVFQVLQGNTVLELKEQMLAPDGTKEDVDAFELKLKGQRVSDLERIYQEHTLDFEYLGVEEGTKRAKEDVADAGKRETEKAAREAKRKAAKPAAKSAGKKATAAAAKPAKPTKVQVVVKHAVEELASQLTVEVMSNATNLDVRKAVMEFLGETQMSEVKLVTKAGQSFTSLGDQYPIGTTRQFLSMGRKLAMPTGPMVLNVTIDEEMDFKTEVEIERGSTLHDVKLVIAAQDPTGSTDPNSFGLGFFVPGVPSTALADATKVYDKHKELQLTDPYIAPPPEPEPPEEPEEEETLPAGTAIVEVIPAKPYWQVIGKSAQGGILVREGKDKSSAELERLGTGSVVEQLKLVGDRLHFKKIVGDGPPEGWVSLSVSGKELVARIEPGHPDALTIERCLAMQAELRDAFASDYCQKGLREILEECPERKREYNKRKNNLILQVQVGPISRYGFEGSNKGVQAMMMAFGPHNWHEQTTTVGDEISRLLVGY